MCLLLNNWGRGWGGRHLWQEAATHAEENPLKRGLFVCSVEAMASQQERRARLSAEFAGAPDPAELTVSEADYERRLEQAWRAVKKPKTNFYWEANSWTSLVLGLPAQRPAGLSVPEHAMVGIPSLIETMSTRADKAAPTVAGRPRLQLRGPRQGSRTRTGRSPRTRRGARPS